MNSINPTIDVSSQPFMPLMETYGKHWADLVNNTIGRVGLLLSSDDAA